MDPEYKRIIDFGELKDKLELIEKRKLSPELIDHIIEVEEDTLVSDLIYYQDLQFHQHMKLLEGNNLDLLRDRIEMYADELTLPQDVIDEIIRNEVYYIVRTVMASIYPLSQKRIKKVLEKETDIYEIISIIQSQSLDHDLILYILDEKIKEIMTFEETPRKTWQKLIEYLVYYQNLPDNVILQILEDREQIMDLIHGQHLSNKWIKQILSDNDLEDFHYELVRMQTFDDELAEYVFNMRDQRLIYSLVRLQKLSKDHIVRGLNSGYSSIITGILEYQEFVDVEQEELVLRYSEHEDLVRSKPDSNSNISLLSNRRHMRDARLRNKKRDIF